MCLYLTYLRLSKHEMLLYLEDRTRRSAGKNLLLCTLTMSPTTTYLHSTHCQCPERNTSTSRWLISSSALWRFCRAHKNSWQIADYCTLKTISPISTSSPPIANVHPATLPPHGNSAHCQLCVCRANITALNTLLILVHLRRYHQLQPLHQSLSANASPLGYKANRQLHGTSPEQQYNSWWRWVMLMASISLVTLTRLTNSIPKRTCSLLHTYVNYYYKELYNYLKLHSVKIGINYIIFWVIITKPGFISEQLRQVLYIHTFFD